MTSARFPMQDWHDSDLPLLADALTTRGASVDIREWDAVPQGAWDSYDVVVIQSPWSMWEDLARFDAWLAARVEEGVRLFNADPVLRAGMDKRYLGALTTAGCPVVPTRYLEPGGAPVTEAIASMLALAQPLRRSVVVKPVAAGGALGIGEFSDVDEAAAHIQRLHRSGDSALVQPYLTAIDAHRELDVVLLDGEISHAVTKRAILQPGEARHAFHPDPQPAPEVVDHAETVLDVYRAFVDLLPAATRPWSVRLDFIVDPASPRGLLLLEIEAVAPVKFFRLFPGKAQEFAATIIEG